MVKLYNTDKPSCFIASGISYPWIRLIGNRDLFSDIRGDYIKLDINISNPVPSLMSAREPTFIVSSECCGAFFSYYSTYPQRYKICYLGGDEIQLDWIREHCDLIEDPKEAISNELYVMGRRDLFTDDIINISKESYLV